MCLMAANTNLCRGIFSCIHVWHECCMLVVFCMSYPSPSLALKFQCCTLKYGTGSSMPSYISSVISGEKVERWSALKYCAHGCHKRSTMCKEDLSVVYIPILVYVLAVCAKRLQTELKAFTLWIRFVNMTYLLLFSYHLAYQAPPIFLTCILKVLSGAWEWG